MTPDDEFAAADAMALVTRQQNEIQRRMAAGVPVILAAWGIAWLVGFSALWLIDGLAPQFRLPLPIAVASFITLLVAAIVVSIVAGIRMGRGVRGTAEAAWTGTVYGLTWPVGFFAMSALGGALTRAGMPPEAANIFYPTASVMFVGIMYIVAGAIWHTWQTIAMGAWMVLVACVAPFFGYPMHYLVFGIAGGGVFLVGAVVSGLWVRGGARRGDERA